MRVLICGDRHWNAHRPIAELLSQFPADTVVIHGGAAGADSIAGFAARDQGLAVVAFPADWTTYGRAAGPIRNARMLNEGQPDEVHAFHNNIEKSRGTKDMVRQAREAGVPVTIHTLASAKSRNV
jgi:hypothetical protein